MSEKQGNAQSSEQFLREVHAVSQAEANAQKKIALAQEEAQKIRADAQAKAVEMAAKANSDSVEVKNRAIAKMRKKSEEQTEIILKNGQKKAAQLASRRLSEQAAEDISSLV